MWMGRSLNLNSMGLGVHNRPQQSSSKIDRLNLIRKFAHWSESFLVRFRISARGVRLPSVCRKVSEKDGKDSGKLTLLS
jgi:hypothetical protein